MSQQPQQQQSNNNSKNQKHLDILISYANLSPDIA
ncbi:hypothetical protein J2W68_001736 [Luteimonas terrae]|uniref:Uncharacterized protein n=1 Tax=Luteimonas terrae TaxID=1530191 RepID=A0ABU1XW73_9GAMM|nr:hypothetical protein [Luteimonas terrae]